MAKMITKGVAFNPESRRHMELLEWVESEQKNFSSYVRELIAIQYEKRKQIQGFDDNFDIKGMI
jgi:hypothetical protein